jgi:hypothetical protein
VSGVAMTSRRAVFPTRDPLIWTVRAIRICLSTNSKGQNNMVRTAGQLLNLHRSSLCERKCSGGIHEVIV